jgi:mitogen-activated protein kinase 1/3
VVTRWYRAPEVILSASEYTKQIDTWSIGCILAELLGRSPLFPGDDYLDQVQRIICVIGTPSQEDLCFVSNPAARRFIQRLPNRKRMKMSSLYPKANPMALDLLDKMLVFNPAKRWTILKCMRHPYFHSMYSPDDELLSE